MEYLTLLFDEPISTETFVPTNFRIQSRQDSIKNSYKLTGGYVTSVLNSVTSESDNPLPIVIKANSNGA